MMRQREFIWLAFLVSLLNLFGCRTHVGNEGQVVNLETNPLKAMKSSDIEKVEYSVLYGRKDAPHIAEGLEVVLTTKDRDDIEKLTSRLQAINDGIAGTPPIGYMVRIDLYKSNGQIMATVDVLWDGASVVISGPDAGLFRKKDRQFAMYCFNYMKMIAPEYIAEVLAELRPAPPLSFLKERYSF